MSVINVFKVVLLIFSLVLSFFRVVVLDVRVFSSLFDLIVVIDSCCLVWDIIFLMIIVFFWVCFRVVSVWLIEER